MWSRVGSASITTVSPGAASPANSVADFNCAEGTGGLNTIGIGSRAPASVSGRRPSAEASVRAPMRCSGSSTRCIGRLRSEASPSNVAVIGQPATAPSASRQPVPELPKSSGIRRFGKAADADAVDQPLPLAGALDAGAKRPQGLRRVEDVLAFEQAADAGRADRERAKNKRANRDRFVARHANASRKADRCGGR